MTYQNRQCVCVAKHQSSLNGTFGEASIAFNVLHKPNITTFSIVYPMPFYEDGTVYLDCMIHGGNPLATLTWNCVNVSKETSSRIKAQPTIQRLTINSIDRSYNNKQCTCTVSHVALSSDLKTSVTVIVYYPPGVPTLSVDTAKGDELPWLDRPGFRGVLTCTAIPGNPQYTRIYWYNNGVRESRQPSASLIFDPPDRSYNGREFRCKAVNNHTDTKGHVALSNTQKLNIEYDPEISMNETEGYVNESLLFQRKCSAKGNPTPSVAWHLNDTLVQSGEILKYKSTDREKAGTYTCKATANSNGGNGRLSSSRKFNLIVQYGPDVNLSTISNIKENDPNVQIKCLARGVPTHFVFNWRHWVGSTLIRETFDHIANTGSLSTLTIDKVTYQDMGIYRCNAENGYNGRNGQIRQESSLELNVSSSPRVINASDRYVTEKGARFDINITFISFPEPTSTTVIMNNGTASQVNELNKIVTTTKIDVKFHSTTVGLDGFNINLRFNEIDARHAGKYRLHICNGFSSAFPFEVVISDKPDPPTHLTIRSITTTSAVVSWIPGDNNGHNQQFTLICESISSDKLWNVTLDERDTSLTLLNLDTFTKYIVSVYSSNIKGVSDPVTTTFTTTTDWVIIGAGGAAVLFLVISVITLVLIIRRKRRPSTHRKNTLKETHEEKEEESDDDGDGLKENILYESAGPYFRTEPGPSHEGNSKDVYAVVMKPPKLQIAETQLYAVVQKPSKGGPYKRSKQGHREQNENTDNIQAVAEISFSNRRIQGNTIDHGKSLTENSSSALKEEKFGLAYIDFDIEDEDASEGRRFVIRGLENKNDYEEVDFSRQADPLPQGSNSEGVKRNKDGLIYTGIAFDDEELANKDGKFVIRGNENRTNYAEVDFSRRPDPLLTEYGTKEAGTTQPTGGMGEKDCQ